MRLSILAFKRSNHFYGLILTSLIMQIGEIQTMKYGIEILNIYQVVP